MRAVIDSLNEHMFALPFEDATGDATHAAGPAGDSRASGH